MTYDTHDVGTILRDGSGQLYESTVPLETGVTGVFVRLRGGLDAFVRGPEVHVAWWVWMRWEVVA